MPAQIRVMQSNAGLSQRIHRICEARYQEVVPAKIRIMPWKGPDGYSRSYTGYAKRGIEGLCKLKYGLCHKG